MIHIFSRDEHDLAIFSISIFHLSVIFVFPTRHGYGRDHLPHGVGVPQALFSTEIFLEVEVFNHFHQTNQQMLIKKSTTVKALY